MARATTPRAPRGSPAIAPPIPQQPKKPRRRTRNGTAAVIAAIAPIAVAGIGKIPSAPTTTPPPIVVRTIAAPQSTAAPGPGAPAAAPAPPAGPQGRVVSDMDVNQCLSRYKDVALPYERGDDAAARQTIVCRRGYVLSYDATTHDPDWVMEVLTPAELAGAAKRSNQFGQDKLLGGIDASNADYSKSGFDRGHQAPAGDAKFSQAIMDQSFFFSNMAPQIGIGFNRGAWKYLEESVRDWVTCGGHARLFVFTGPIYGTRDATIGADRVDVPTAFFKILYDPDSDRAVGFVLPHTKIGATIPDLQPYVKPISEIEGETGLDFFRNFDTRHQTMLEAQAATAWGHIGACAGDDGGD